MTKKLISILLVGGVLGIIIWLSGIVPIRASSGHWPITAWFLNFSMERSISTYSLGNEVPSNLDDHGLFMRGAGHYEIGCKQCHGGLERPGFIGQMTTPKAPHLRTQVKNWKPEELFEIVKHGVKFTGMPAWPSHKRDDEVWAMVAFLLKLPSLTLNEYQNTVHILNTSHGVLPSQYQGEISGSLLVTCANCHGLDGNGRGNRTMPKLASQNQEYLEKSLWAYKKNSRHSGTMELISSTLEAENIKALSKYFNRQRISKTDPSYFDKNQEAIKRGEQIAKKGIPEHKVAACIGCHGPNKHDMTQKPHFPELRSQPAPYLVEQLKLFINKKRGGTKHAKLMRKAVPSLTQEQMFDVSLYYESLEINR